MNHNGANKAVYVILTTQVIASRNCLSLPHHSLFPWMA